MSKPITSYVELIDVCRKCTSYFIGSLTLEFIMNRKKWENPETKSQYIECLHNEFSGWNEKATLDQTRNRANCLIRIIESHRVEEALEYVVNGNPLKMDVPEVREYAQEVLDMIHSGKLKY